MAEAKDINPWAWQDEFGFSQAKDVADAKRVVFCSGQTSVDPNGAPLHAGDMAKQVDQAFDNLESVLGQAGLSLAHVVRLNYYTTDMDAFLAASESSGPRLTEAGCKPSSTLLGVSCLFHPDLMIEATAVE